MSVFAARIVHHSPAFDSWSWRRRDAVQAVKPAAVASAALSVTVPSAFGRAFDMTLRSYRTGSVNDFVRMTRILAALPTYVTSISMPDAVSVQRPPRR